MSTPIDTLVSYAKKFYSSLFGSIGTPGTLATGDTDWSPNEAATAALADMVKLATGQILMGASGTSALTRPGAGPTLTASTGGTLATGNYDVSYTYTNIFGETLASTTPTTVAITGPTGRIAVTAITPLPTGVTGVNWYVSDAPGSITPRLKVSNVGAAFNIDSVPSGTAALQPSTNTTASTDHAEKGTPTGSSGIVVTTSSGGLDFAYSPTNHNDQNGFYLRRLRIENFTTGGEPTGLTTSDKGRLYYNTTVPTLKVWDGAAWQIVGSGVISLTSAHILVGNVSNVATDVAVSGDVSLNNSGVFTVTAINGVTVTTTPSTGKVLTATGTSAATWQTPAAQPDASTTVKGITKLSVAPVSSTAPIAVGDNDSRMTDARTPIGTALTSGNVVVGNGSNIAAAVAVSGDGTLSNAGVLGVTKVQGKAFASTAPTAGQVPTWNNTTSQYEPASPAGGSGAANATSIQGVNVSSTAPTNGQALVYNSGTSQYVPGTVSGGGGSVVKVQLHNSANQTISNNLETGIAFDVEDSDTDGFHSNVTNNTRITIPAGLGGTYLLNAGCVFQTSGTGQRAVHILKNGTDVLAGFQISANPSDVWAATISFVGDFVAGDYLELFVYQNSGGNLLIYSTIYSYTKATVLSALKLG